MNTTRSLFAATICLTSLMSAREILDFPSPAAPMEARVRLFLAKRGIPSLGQHQVTVDTRELTRASLVEFRLLDGQMLTARLWRFDARGANSFAWRGKLEGGNAGDGGGGDVLFTVHEGLVSAYIDAKSGIHQIIPVGGGGHALIRVNTERSAPCLTAPDANAVHSAQKPSALPAVMDGMDGSDPVVDVSVIYTSTAKDEAGGQKEIESQVQSMIDTTNMVFENSKVAARIRLASTYELDYAATEQDTQSSFLAAMREDEQIRANRDRDKADLVALIVSRGEGEESGCGIAYLINEKNKENGEGGFSVTKLSCAVGLLTFSHEIGHNFGAQHNPENGGDPAEAARPYAFGHYVNGKFRTLMAYEKPCPDGCKRIPYLSNPEVQYEGEPTGIAGERDNAKLARETAPFVAKFR